MRAIIVDFVGLFDFVGLVDGVDGLLDVPETVRVSVVLIRKRQKRYTYWSMVVFSPKPPNSPWIAIRLGSNGVDWME